MWNWDFGRVGAGTVNMGDGSGVQYPTIVYCGGIVIDKTPII